MDGSRCRGARYLKEDQTQAIYAEREVILCAGAIASPKLLMLSGIGPAPQLRKHGLPVVADLPGVGENLHDHPISWVSYSTTQSADATPSRQACLLSRSAEHVDPDVFMIFLEAAVEPHWQGAGFHREFGFIDIPGHRAYVPELPHVQQRHAPNGVIGRFERESPGRPRGESSTPPTTGDAPISW
jgi:hypothetical protein